MFTIHERKNVTPLSRNHIIEILVNMCIVKNDISERFVDYLYREHNPTDFNINNIAELYLEYKNINRSHRNTIEILLSCAMIDYSYDDIIKATQIIRESHHLINNRLDTLSLCVRLMNNMQIRKNFDNGMPLRTHLERQYHVLLEQLKNIKINLETAMEQLKSSSHIPTHNILNADNIIRESYAINTPPTHQIPRTFDDHKNIHIQTSTLNNNYYSENDRPDNGSTAHIFNTVRDELLSRRPNNTIVGNGIRGIARNLVRDNPIYNGIKFFMDFVEDKNGHNTVSNIHRENDDQKRRDERKIVQEQLRDIRLPTAPSVMRPLNSDNISRLQRINLNLPSRTYDDGVEVRLVLNNAATDDDDDDEYENDDRMRVDIEQYRKTNINEEKKEIECGICMETIKEGEYYKFPCGHGGHVDCEMQRWFESHNTCPFCRVAL